MRRWRIVPTTVLAMGLVASGLTSAHAAPTPSPTPTATASAPVGQKLALTTAGGVLTLPAGDGFNDRTTARVVSGAAGRVDLIARGDKAVIVLATEVALKRTRTGWARTIAIDAKSLIKGTWTLTTRRSTDAGVRATAAGVLRVGSGKPVTTTVTPSAGTLYPYRDGSLDRLTAIVDARDETGTSLPVTGTAVLTIAKLRKKVSLRATTALSPTGTVAGLAKAGLSVVCLPFGTATLVTTVKGPAGKARTAQRAVTLAPTGVGTIRLARSSDTVQPVRDGLLDSVTLTPSGLASGGSTAALTGTVVIRQGRTPIVTWPVTKAMTPLVWDGRVNGRIVPGTYTATLTLTGPQGTARSVTQSITVSSAHLPYRVRDLFTVSAGNQQGLAVRDGLFYIGFDNGDGTSRVDIFNGSGTQVDWWGPISIGHAAELSYSTTTGRIYAAGGGAANPTMVWPMDPATKTVEAPIDLSALGNNGMVAVDDANNRLLVFSGTAPDFRITPVSLTATTTTDPSTGAVTTVPAYTVGASVPIAITGVPQGIEVVNGQLWVYTSLKKINRIAKYGLDGVPAVGTDATSDLMYTGEGEGLAIDLPTGTIYVGAHSQNRIGVLEAVADE